MIGEGVSGKEVTIGEVTKATDNKGIAKLKIKSIGDFTINVIFEGELLLILHIESKIIFSLNSSLFLDSASHMSYSIQIHLLNLYN